MSNFGSIIDRDVPVLIMFFTNTPQLSVENANVYSGLRDVAATYGDKVNVIKVDIKKNEELVEALRVKHNPTYFIYYKGDQLTRKNKKMSPSDLIAMLKPLIEES